MIDVIHRSDGVAVLAGDVAVNLPEQRVALGPCRPWPALRVEVVPHRLPGEGEQADGGETAHPPTRAFFDRIGDACEIGFDASLRIVIRQSDIETLELLAQSYIDRLVVIAAGDRENILAISDALFHINWQQYQRCEGWLGRILDLVPFEKADGAMQCTEARVLLQGACRAIPRREFRLQPVRKKQ